MIESHANGVQTIAISSQKGGVGKTTTSLALGAALAEQGQRVLMVDLDPQAHLTQTLGIDPDNLRHSVGDVLLRQASLVEVSRENQAFNLDVTPANRGLILVEKLMHTSKGYEFRLKDALESLGGQYYDLVIFDCPPSFGPLTLNALTAARLVVIPMTCDVFSTQSLKSYLNLLEVVRRNTNPSIDVRLLVTLYDGRTRLSQMILSQIKQRYGRIVFETVIPLDTKLRESPLFERPITQYASRARGAQEYRALARELLLCLEKTI
jgi:chromosome partitioning protein